MEELKDVVLTAVNSGLPAVFYGIRAGNYGWVKTSPVKSIRFDGGDFVLETARSVYHGTLKAAVEVTDTDRVSVSVGSTLCIYGKYKDRRDIFEVGTVKATRTLLNGIEIHNDRGQRFDIFWRE